MLLPFGRNSSRDGTSGTTSGPLRVVDFPGEESFAQRAERDEANPEFLQSWHHLRFGLAPPQRVFALERGHRLNGVRATDRLHSSLRKTKVLYLAPLNQILHRSVHVFDP